MLHVKKFNGEMQPFQKGKIFNTCLRMHASPEQAKAVADQIEKEAFNGITTKEILRLIFRYLSRYRTGVKYQTDLRTAISLLRPKPDFERFVGTILEELGYKIEMNRVVNGRCIEHEVDVIAKNKDESILVEVKHHVNPHVYIGLETFLEYWAAFEDLVAGRNNYKFNSLLIACNTKVSEHAKRYASCKNIRYIAWKSPENSLENIIEGKKLYPITVIKGLDKKIQEKLGDKGIILLRELVEGDVGQLHSITGVSVDKLNAVKKIAEKILLF